MIEASTKLGRYEIRSVAGKSDEAVKWLREAAATGFPCYLLFERDIHLDRTRQAPAFIQFMAEMKTENESTVANLAEDDQCRHKS